MLERILGQIDTAITNRTTTVIVAFLLVTGAFLYGATLVSSDSGTSQFTEDLPSQEALDSINNEFLASRSSPGGQTLLIQERKNVLSKDALVQSAQLENRLADRSELRVQRVSSVARATALTIDPTATTPSERVSVLEQATPTTLTQNAQTAIQRRGLQQSVSSDYNSEDTTASFSIISVSHAIRGVGSGSVGTNSESPLTGIQLTIQRISQNSDASVTVFGSGIQSSELASVTTDSLLLVLPVAFLLIVLFLALAYKDIIDMVIGIGSLLMTIIWTYGFMGFAGIPFTQLLVSIPPLLLAVGIDFGIHAVNRYREELISLDEPDKEQAMIGATDQLIVAFGIVTGTTIVGFGSNVLSPLGPISQFGVVAAIGICFTFLIFGIFLPAIKLKLDTWREQSRLPESTARPLGTGDSALSRLLLVGYGISQRLPLLLVLTFVVAGGASAVYATGISSEFSQDSFLPPEDQPDYVSVFPDVIQPGEYDITDVLNLLEREFSSTGQTTLTVYVTGDMREDAVLEGIQRVNDNPPDSVATTDENTARQRSVLSVIDSAKQQPSVQNIVSQNDINQNGVPDDNLLEVYDTVETANPALNRFLSEERDATRIVYTMESDATNTDVRTAGRAIEDQLRPDATATGPVIVRQAVSDLILSSTVRSLVVALSLTVVFLSVVYRRLEGMARLSLVNVIPVFITIAFVAGTMRYLQIPLNALTATTLSIAIGLGVDYTVHMTHRITDEDETRETDEAIRVSVQGTGGALFGSMVTTVCGIGSLTLAITPLLGQFGTVISIGIVYSFVTSVLLIPSLYKLLVDRPDY